MKTFSLTQTVSLSAVETLKNGLSKDKTDKHAFIVAQVATIVALALCKAPPKGHGNPADWKALPEIFKSAGLKNYGEHCAAFPQYLKATGQRSVAEWTDAYAMAADATIAAFSGCAPRTLTPEQVAERQAKKDAKKTEKAAAEKAAAAELKAQHKADRLQAFEEGRASVKADRQQAYDEGRASVAITAQAVADMVTSGIFSDADVETIGAAIMARVTLVRAAAPVALPA